MSSYIHSITSIPGDLGVADIRAETKLHRICSCMPKSVVDVLSEMLDISLLTNAGFMLICLGNILAMIGFYVPYVFLVDRAIMLDIDKTQASFLLSVIGRCYHTTFHVVIPQFHVTVSYLSELYTLISPMFFVHDLMPLNISDRILFTYYKLCFSPTAKQLHLHILIFV